MATTKIALSLPHRVSYLELWFATCTSRFKRIKIATFAKKTAFLTVSLMHHKQCGRWGRAIMTSFGSTDLGMNSAHAKQLSPV